MPAGSTTSGWPFIIGKMIILSKSKFYYRNQNLIIEIRIFVIEIPTPTINSITVF